MAQNNLILPHRPNLRIQLPQEPVPHQLEDLPPHQLLFQLNKQEMELSRKFHDLVKNVPRVDEYGVIHHYSLDLHDLIPHHIGNRIASREAIWQLQLLYVNQCVNENIKAALRIVAELHHDSAVLRDNQADNIVRRNNAEMNNNNY